MQDRTYSDLLFLIQSLVGDNTYISKHYEKQLFELDELSKQRLLYGNWEYDVTNDSLIE